MRKTLITTAVMAVSAVSLMAQVYSQNIVGYVNVTCPPSQYTLMANPFNSADSDLNAVIPGTSVGLAAGSTITTWDSGLNNWSDTTSTLLGDPDNIWDPTQDAPLGKGLFFYNAGGSPVTITFVGEVLNGSHVETLNNGQFKALGSAVPLGGAIENALVGLTPEGGDTATVWDSAANNWSDATTTYLGDPDFMWDPPLSVDTGKAFFYYRAGADTTWTRTYTAP